MGDPVYIPGAPDGPEPQWARDAKAKVREPGSVEHPGNANPCALNIAACLSHWSWVLVSQTEKMSSEAFDEAHRELRERAMRQADDFGIRRVDVEAAILLLSKRPRDEVEERASASGLLDQLGTDLTTVAEVIGS